MDGDWEDDGEHVLDDVTVSNGLNTLPINIPANAFVGNTIARVRVTDTAGYSFHGLAATGEVEDELVNIATASSSPSYLDPGSDDADRGVVHGSTDMFFANLGAGPYSLSASGKTAHSKPAFAVNWMNRRTREPAALDFDTDGDEESASVDALLFVSQRNRSGGNAERRLKSVGMNALVTDDWFGYLADEKAGNWHDLFCSDRASQ